MGSICDIAITGVGLISPLGIGNQGFWEALIGGKSGIAVRPEFRDSPHPFRIAGAVADFEPKQYVKPRKALKVMCRPIQFGFAASSLASDSAEITGNVDPTRLSTIFGTEAFYADPNEVASVFRTCMVNRCYDHDRWGQAAMREIEPLWMLKYLPNMVASHISIAVDARGRSNTICQSDASSLLALIESIDLIQRGGADVVIAGGTGSQMATTGMIYRGLHRLSRRIDDPERASRPFDVDRDGMVAGEGAGVFILERTEYAQARGATIHGRILGYNRAFHPIGPDFGNAIAASISSAVQHAGLAPTDIGHVNAQGFSTVEDDIYEAQGIRQALGDVPVFAPKSNFGNLGPGTGAVELAASLEAGRHRTIPATLNVEHLDPRCPINLSSHSQSVPNATGLKINFSDTGQIVTMVVSAD